MSVRARRRGVAMNSLDRRRDVAMSALARRIEARR
jgi:hypothetical protein